MDGDGRAQHGHLQVRDRVDLLGLLVDELLKRPARRVDEREHGGC